MSGPRPRPRLRPRPRWPSRLGRGRRESAAASASPAAPGWLGGSCCSLSSVKPWLKLESFNLQRSPILYFRATTFFSLPMSLLYPLLCIYGAWKKLFKKFPDQSSYLLPNSPDPSSLLPKLEPPPLSCAFDLTQSGRGYIL